MRYRAACVKRRGDRVGNYLLDRLRGAPQLSGRTQDQVNDMRHALIGVWLAAMVLLTVQPAAARAPASGPARVATLQAKIDQLNKQLANLSSYQAQVKDLQVRLIRIKQVLARLARAAEAPRTLATELDKLRRRIAELARRVEQVRLAKVRVAYEQADARPAGRVNGGYDGGFYVASGNDRYRLQVNGVLRFTGKVGQVTSTASDLRPAEKYHLLGMDVPGGFVQLSGHVYTKKLTYLLELDFGGGRGVALNDFAFHWRAHRFFGVTVGQQVVGFSRQQVADPYDTMFVDTSPAALAFGKGRDIGIKLHFYQWKERIFQELAVFNGAGFNSGGNDNVDLMYVARVGIAPLGPVPGAEGDLRRGSRPFRFRVAAGYLFNPMPAGRDLDGADGMDSIFVHQAAAELTLVAKGFSFNGEFYYRMEDHGKAVTELAESEQRLRPSLGGFAQASYTVKRVWLQPTVRYSYVEPVAWWSAADGAMSYGWVSPIGGAVEPTPEGSAALTPESVHELTVGLNWYAYGPHLKLILNYTYLWERGYLFSTGTVKRSRQIHLGSLLVQGRF